MISIYRLIADVETIVSSISNKNASYKSGIMGIEEVQVDIVVDSILDIQTDDYIKYNGINYTLNRDDEFTKRSDVEYEYNLVFEHPLYRLLDKLFALSTTGSINFILSGKLIDFMSLVVWNMNYDALTNPLGVDSGWSTGSAIDTAFKTLTFNSTSCLDVLTMLVSEFNVEFYFDNKEINYVERIENASGLTFIQGQGLGLYEVTKQNVDKQDTITRIYPVGSNKNVPNANADPEGYLKLPEIYIENTSEISRIVEKRVVFEDIYPHFEGTVETVSGTNNEELICEAIDFDLNAIAIGTEARINFLTGDLMGIAFEFQWDNALKKITLIEHVDDTALADTEGIKPNVPRSTRKAAINDQFNFTGVTMPDSYVTAAISLLRATATDWLAFYSHKRIKFVVDIDHRWMRGKSELKAGDTITIQIPQKSITALLRITALDKNLNTGKLSATVSNFLEEKWQKKIEGSLTSLTTSVNSEIIKAATLQARLEAAKYITQAISGSAEFNGGLELINLLLMKGLDGIVRAGLSGLYGDKVGMFVGGTYENAQDETCDVLFKKDGTGGQLAGGNIKWDGDGNTNFKGIIEALGGKIGGLSIFNSALMSDSMEFSEEPIETLADLKTPVTVTISRQSSWTGLNPVYTQDIVLATPSLITFNYDLSGAVTNKWCYVKDSAGNIVWDFSEYVATDITNKFPAGTYHIEISVIPADVETGVTITLSGKQNIDHTTYSDDIIGVGFVNKTKIGNDGFFSFKDSSNYFYYSQSTGMETRNGSVGGMQVNWNGVKYWNGTAWVFNYMLIPSITDMPDQSKRRTLFVDVDSHLIYRDETI